MRVIIAMLLGLGVFVVVGALLTLAYEGVAGQAFNPRDFPVALAVVLLSLAASWTTATRIIERR